MWVRGNAVGPKEFCIPFLGRAGSGVKPKWVTAEVAAGMGLRNCFRDRIKRVGVSRCLVQPLFGHLWVQERFLYFWPLEEALPLSPLRPCKAAGAWAAQESPLPISWGLMGSLTASPGTCWVSCRESVHPPSLPSFSIPSLRSAKRRGEKTQKGWMEVTQRLRSAGAGGNSLDGSIFFFLPALSPLRRPLCNAERSKAQGWQLPTGFTIDREPS